MIWFPAFSKYRQMVILFLLNITFLTFILVINVELM